jgi:hypothetical protein
MEHAETATSCPNSPPEPQPDRAARTIPGRIAFLLHTVRIMLGFGRHLAATAKDRSASPDFNAVAVCFGTSRLSAILAHLQRGILRAMALENVLLARAAQGRDIRIVAPRKRAAVTPAAPADPPGEASVQQPTDPPDEASVQQPADAAAELSAEAPVARKVEARPSRPFGWNDPELFMPTLEELEAQVRRRPIGRTLVEICLDLAVVPGFCAGPFWNDLFDTIRVLGGSIPTLMQTKTRREQAFSEEQDKKPGSNWDWQEMGRDALRRVLGFFIGEVTDDSYDPLPQPCGPAAAATGPP